MISTLAMRLPRVVVLAALVGASLATSVGRAGAQDSGLQGDDTYVSPKFGFEVVWGGSWAYLDESEAESGADRDHIDLISSEFLAILHITALTDVIDPDDQLASTIESQQEGLEAAGEAFEILGENSGRDHVSAALEYTIGAETQRQYIEISDMQDRAGEDGTLVLQMMAVEDGAADAFADLVDSVTLDGDPIVLGDLEETIAGAGQDDEPADDEPADDEPATDDETPVAGDTGLDGNEFTDARYGWSVAFDEDVWEAEDADGGLWLFAGDDASARLIVYEDGITDAGDCLDDLDRAFTSNDDWEGLAESRRLDPPATVSDAEGQLYTGALVAVDPEVDVVLYLECREVEDATLSISIWVAEDGYEDMLPDLEDLLAAVETDGPVQDDSSSGGDDAAAGGIDGNTYTNTEYGWSVEFDDAFWQEVKEIDEPGRQGISLGGGDAFVNLIVFPEGETEPDACLDDLEAVYTDTDDVEDVERARTFDPPATSREAVGALYTGSLVLEDGDLAVVIYLECRGVDGGALTFVATVAEESYEDLLPDLEALLAGIETDASTENTDNPDDEETTDPDAEETPESDEPDVAGNDPDAGEIEGNTFTDTTFDYSVTWDDELWTGELLEGGDTAGIVLASTDAAAVSYIVIDARGGFDGIVPAECVQNLAVGFGDFEGFSTLEKASQVDAPIGPPNAAGDVFSYTLTADDGSESDLVMYIECRPIGDDSMIQISVRSDEATFEANVERYQDVLDSIEIGA